MEGFSSPGQVSTASMPEFLTPRTKVARLLADIDNESTPSPSSNRLALSHIENGKAQDTQRSTDLSSSNSPSRQSNTAPFLSDEDSDDEVRKPIGRAARRMLPGTKNDSDIERVQRDAAVFSPLRVPDAPSDGSVSYEDDLYSATPQKTSNGMSLASLPHMAYGKSDLFVSPAKSIQEHSEDDLAELPVINKGRLADLVAQKRAERLAKESEKNNSAATAPSSDLPEEMVESSTAAPNPELDRIMSDAAKPTRKASKKAMLEMERETQRLARQQALTHQMKVKKRFTTSGLFSRFNYRPIGAPEIVPQPEVDITSSSAPNSDGFDPTPRKAITTPPSSPPTPLDRQRALVEKGALSKLVPIREDSIASLADLDASEFPDISTILSQSRDHDSRRNDPTERKGLRLARLGKKAMILEQKDDSDDELEIVREIHDDINIFEKAKKAYRNEKADSRAIHTLKHLAHLHGDAVQPRRGRKGTSQPSINPTILEAQLLLRAKEQARAQQLERIAELKAKGINVQTSEEREREAEEFENLLEKARQDAAALRKAEKAAAKGNGDISGKASDDDSGDDDYEGSDSDMDDVNEEGSESLDLIEEAAEETDADDSERDDDSEMTEVDEHDLAESIAGPEKIDHFDGRNAATTAEDVDEPAPLNARKSRKSRIVVDDEDDGEDGPGSKLSPNLPATVEEQEEQDPFAAFNFGQESAALMSPTQAFNATMRTPTQFTQQDSMEILQKLVPQSSVPSSAMAFEDQAQDQSQATIIPNSQVHESQRVDLTEPPETPISGSKQIGATLTMDTPGWEPSQDIGLPASWQGMSRLEDDVFVGLTPSHETQSTVRLRISESPAPANYVKKRKRLVQRPGAILDSSDDENVETTQALKQKEKNAFREMARKQKEALSATELAEAERAMKGMMDEQAEESEDEYAGLGGDDYVAPENEDDRAMIDSSQIDVDERALAAHFAERQRIADEAQASKLYKDLMTGALRRKQANMFDLDEDEDDLALRRRQMRQREEARKRRLLLQDDNIAGLAEGKLTKGRDAFLKSIADDDDGDDEALELPDQDDEFKTSQTQTDSQQSQGEAVLTPALREVSGNKRRPDDSLDERRPAKQRRTQASAFRAPTSLIEVKESVSFLLDDIDTFQLDPSVLEEDNESDNDAEEPQHTVDEGEDAMEVEFARQNDGGFAPDRATEMPPPRLPASQRRTRAKASVVDRLLLKRGSSTSDGAAARTAWGPSASGTFKVPSLLRRATTNVAVGANERGVTTSNGISRENSGVKMGGSKKSSLAYQARAEEHRSQVEASARKRAENTARIAQLRRGNSSLLGSGLAGQFE